MSFEASLATTLRASEKNAIVRASKLKLLPICGRCCGGGHYSFNGSHSICYGCAGAGNRPPKNNTERAEVLRLAEIAAADGTLDTYMARLEATRQSKNARDKVMKAWTDSGVSSQYRWTNGYVGSPTFNQRDFDIAAINKKMCVAYETVCNLSFKKDVDPLDVLATMNKSLSDIAAATEELKEYLNA